MSRNRGPAPPVEQPMSRVFSTAVLLLFFGQALPLEAADDLSRYMTAVETIRKRSFTQPVRAITIDRAELPARLRDQLTRTLPYSVTEWAEILEALLLIEPGPSDPFERLIDLYEAQVLAFYDPDTSTYYALKQPPSGLPEMPGGMSTEEGVIVHELTHALQDQHLAIGARALELRKDTDGSMAYHSVLEGEATLVMLAHLIGQSGADFDMLVRQPMFDGLLGTAASADLAIDPSTPRYFAESLKFPYLEGLRVVIHAYRRGGWAELDRVHANPPTSTREILHPADYFEKKVRLKRFVPEPPLDLKPLSVEHLGEFHWAFLVGADNARGWIGDRVTVVQNRWCEPTVLVETSWESESAAQAFHYAYMNALDRKGVGFFSKIKGADVLVGYGADRQLMERFLR